MPPILRAPSTETLKFLRDAALYGSLGTTAGVSLLLYEERRRRICTLQKVVDNGKKLKSVRGRRLVHRSALTGEEMKQLGGTGVLEQRIHKPYKRPAVEIDEQEGYHITKSGDTRSGRRKLHTSAPRGETTTKRARKEVNEHTKRVKWKDEIRRMMSRMQNRRVSGLGGRHQLKLSPGGLNCRDSCHRLYNKYASLSSSSVYPRSLHLDSQQINPVSMDLTSLFYLPPDAPRDPGPYQTPWAGTLKEADILKMPPLFSDATKASDIPAMAVPLSAKSQSMWGSLHTRPAAIATVNSAALPAAIDRAPTHSSALEKFLLYHELRTGQPHQRLSSASLEDNQTEFQAVTSKVQLQPNFGHLLPSSHILETYPSKELVETFLELTEDTTQITSKTVTTIGQDLLRMIARSTHTNHLKRLRDRLKSWGQLDEVCLASLEEHSQELLQYYVDTSEPLAETPSLVRFTGALRDNPYEREALELIKYVWLSRKDRRRKTASTGKSLEEAFNRIIEGSIPVTLCQAIIDIVTKVDTHKEQWTRLCESRFRQVVESDVSVREKTRRMVDMLKRIRGSVPSIEPQVLRVLTEALESGKWKMTSQLVAILDKQDGIDQGNIHLILLSQSDNHHTVERLSAKYESLLPIDPGLIERVCYSIAVVRPVEHAISRIARLCSALDHGILVHTRLDKVGISNGERVLENAYVSILKKCWSTTKNINVVKDVYGMMAATTNLSKGISLMFSAIQVQARHGAGMGPTSVRSNKALEALAEAADRQNWYALSPILDTLNSLEILDAEGQMDALHPLVSVYLSTRTFDEAFSWVKSRIAQHMLKPNEELLRTLVDSALKERRGPDIPNILAYFHSVKTDFMVTPKLAGDLLRIHQQLHRPDSVTLAEMTELLHRNAPGLLSAQLGSMWSQVRDFEASKMSAKEHEEFTTPLALSIRTQSASPAAYWTQIHQWYAHGEYSKVRTAFEGRLAKHKPLTGPILDLTIAACLKETPDDSTLAESIMARARQQGIVVDIAIRRLLAHRIFTTRSDPEMIRRKVFEYYHFNQSKGLAVNHYITLSAAHELINRRKPHLAASLLREVFVSKWTAHCPFDTSIMSCWMKAHAESGNLRGFRSVLLLCERSDLMFDYRMLSSMYKHRHLLLRVMRYENRWPRHFKDIMSRHTHATREWIAEEDLVHLFRHWRSHVKILSRLQKRRNADLGIMLCQALITHSGGCVRPRAYWNTLNSADTPAREPKKVPPKSRAQSSALFPTKVQGMLPASIDILAGEAPAGISGHALHEPVLSTDIIALIGTSLTHDDPDLLPSLKQDQPYILALDSADPDTNELIANLTRRFNHRPGRAASLAAKQFYKNLVWDWVDWPVEITDDELCDWRAELREPDAGRLLYGAREARFDEQDWGRMRARAFREA
ncbi:hypothetical protein EJ05DRAFT_534734 [Pseudovirgaria hyperparasitica]|uniref:Uncharacterized protein n=1 Tax=Pseudovirgaria hyperparasitica TaxID=470096 RepID=A0A6A6WMD1_9PEZI|nr:uncharacterized protein EJ05DRAFT_534734 [Pseudovirgaria hyperparasitica]KAF2763377.1 hypothetical protein EJ05DRAFT_534734 [Pseudovirgaria hyperparasitica]